MVFVRKCDACGCCYNHNEIRLESTYPSKGNSYDLHHHIFYWDACSINCLKHLLKDVQNLKQDMGFQIRIPPELSDQFCMEYTK